MRKLAVLSMLAVSASSVALLGHVQPSNANEQRSATPRHDRAEFSTCSNETLEGVYGVSIGGTRPAPPPPSGTANYVPGTIEQVIGVNTQTFDGDGHLTQVSNDKGSLSGIGVPNRAGSGTYIVNPDCSGTTTLNIPGVPFPIVIDIVIVNHGKEFHGFVASPQPVMVSSYGRRVD